MKLVLLFELADKMVVGGALLHLRLDKNECENEQAYAYLCKTWGLTQPT